MNEDYLNNQYVGSIYGDLRRERKQLMQQLINGDASVKPRIRELTELMLDYMCGNFKYPLK